jgi:uncharacterized protein
MRKKRLAVFTFIVLIFAFSAKVYFDTNYFKLKRVEFYSNKIPEGSEFTILQISDLHNKVFGDNNERLINTVEKSNGILLF